MAHAVAQRLSKISISYPRLARAAKVVSPLLTTGASALSYHLLTGAPTVTGIILTAIIGGVTGLMGVRGATLRVQLVEAEAKASLPPGVLERRLKLDGLLQEQQKGEMAIGEMKERMRRATEPAAKLHLQPQLRGLEASLATTVAGIVTVERELVRMAPLRKGRELGGGGMGRVELYFSEGLGKFVVVKKVGLGAHLSAEQRKMFMNRLEAEAVSQGEVLHQNVARIYAFMEVDEEPALVSEYVDGKDLENMVRPLRRSGKGVDVRTVCRLALQIAHGLKAAHDRGVIHRDLKPANVIVEEGTGKLKLIDFGLARNIDTDPEHRLTVGTSAFGTPEYMPPEQAEDFAGVTKAADVYALGVMIYELLTGRIPHSEGISPSADPGVRFISFHENRKNPDYPLPRVASIGEQHPLQVLLYRLLAIDPATRPDIGTVITELQACLRVG